VPVHIRLSTGANFAARGALDKKEPRFQLDAVAGNAKASISMLQQVVANDEAELASFQTEVSATFGSSFSSLNSMSSAVATIKGWAGASRGVTVNVDGAISGITLVDDSDSDSVINLLADHVQIS
jgi:hypothetical protein